MTSEIFFKLCSFKTLFLSFVFILALQLIISSSASIENLFETFISLPFKALAPFKTRILKYYTTFYSIFIWILILKYKKSPVKGI